MRIPLRAVAALVVGGALLAPRASSPPPNVVLAFGCARRGGRLSLRESLSRFAQPYAQAAGQVRRPRRSGRAARRPHDKSRRGGFETVNARPNHYERASRTRSHPWPT